MDRAGDGEGDEHLVALGAADLAGPPAAAANVRTAPAFAAKLAAIVDL